MKLRRTLGALFIAAISWCMLCTTAFADNELIPYEPGSSTSSSQMPSASVPHSTQKPEETSQIDYTGNLFQKPQIVKDETVAGVTSTITEIASKIITAAISIVPVLLTIQILIDLLCILFKPIALFFSRLPLQINSDEVIAVTGIQFVGTDKDKGTNIEKKDLKENAVLYYFKSRLITIILVMTVFVLLGTGLLFQGVFFIANAVTGWIAGLF